MNIDINMGLNMGYCGPLYKWGSKTLHALADPVTKYAFKYDIGQFVICEKFDSQYYAHVGTILDRVVCESNGKNIYQVEFDIEGLGKRIEYFFESNLIEHEPSTQPTLTDTFDELTDNFGSQYIPLTTGLTIPEEYPDDKPIEECPDDKPIEKCPITISTTGTIQLANCADDGGVTIKQTVDQLDSNVKDIEEKIQDIEKRQKKASKLSKLALLSRLL